VNFNGVFYWLGYGIFYTYSGVVDILKNTMNQQFFHDNVDYSFASKIFAVKYLTRHEIWWFYPTRDSNGECKNAIIYNVQDDIWYDTKIDAQSSVFDSQRNEFYIYGLPMVVRPPLDGVSNVKGFWKIDTYNDYQLDTRSSRTRERNALINSYFVTPWISYATFNNFKQPVGAKKCMQVKQIEPNFAIRVTPPYRADAPENTRMSVTILGKNFANSKIIESANLFFASSDEYISVSNFQARNIAFKFQKINFLNFKAGVSFFEADEGDSQV
jgi:hypothetical protein